ncbi:hypothetical protein GCM10029963_19270 [Micromonospora andamanensis]
MPLAHLDRPFDYLVPQALSADAVPGVRVKVRFAGQLVDGWLLERTERSDHPRLAYLDKVVSPVPVLAPEVARLARVVADRYAGSLADVLRLAVPPRHARVEKEIMTAAPPAGSPELEPEPQPEPEPEGWRDYPAGPALLRALADGRSPRAVWSALPGRTGRPATPQPSPPRWPPAGAHSWWSPTGGISTGSTPRSPPGSGRAGTSACRPRSAPRGATAPS